MTRSSAALMLLILPGVALARESSSTRYRNLSVGGGQAAASATAVIKKSPQTPRPVTLTPPPAPAPASKIPWLAAAGLVLTAALIAMRRAGRRRRADDENLALAAHELQSPLAAIESYLDLMASEAPAASQEARHWLEDLSRMRTTTSHLRRTITDILDMTRVSDGRMKLSPRPVELSALVEEAKTAYAAHAASRGVTIVARVPAGLAQALADPDRLRQVLDNLLGNAIKFTPSGRSIEISAAQTPREVELEVRDDGVGVPAAQRARLFGKFQRLGPAVDGTEGTGLGLHLSRRLAMAQGGRLEYCPREPRGSVFRVTMPRA